MSIYITPISRGLGDLVVFLPVIQHLIASGQQVYLITRSAMQEGLDKRIIGLAGSVSEKDFAPSSLRPTDRHIDLRDHPLQKAAHWGSVEFHQQYGQLRINDILNTICGEAGITADFTYLQSLPFAQRSEFANCIILVPGCNGSYKAWPNKHWLSLNSDLCNQGFKVVLLGQPDFSSEVRTLIDAGIKWIPTPHITDALDIISSCRAVVAVDTGLMHLAVQQRVPTVALFRHYCTFLRQFPHCNALIAEPCPPQCSDHCRPDAHVQEGWNKDLNYCRLAEDDSCMGRILPQAVHNALQQVMVSHSGQLPC